MAWRSTMFPNEADDRGAYAPVAQASAKRAVLVASSDEFGNRGKPSGATFFPVGLIAPLYLIGLAVAEIVTAFVDAGWGALCHGALVAAATALAGRAAFRNMAGDQSLGRSPRPLEANFYVALTLPPLIRLVSLAMPLEDLSEPARYGAITMPLLGAAWAATRANGYDRRDVGLVLRWSWRGLPLDLIVASTGIAIGYAEYRSRRPESLIDAFEPNQMVIASLVFIAGAGIVEELLLRGVIQVAGSALFGPAVGIAYVAVLFAILHIGYRSWLDVGLAFIVAVMLGLAVRTTGSLVGAMLAHSIANVCLFVVFPLLLQQ